MNSQSVTKTFDATLDALPYFMGWVEGLVMPLDLPVHQIQLALEEAFVNIIRHAYPGKAGKIKITFKHLPGKQIEWEIRDQGEPFDPTRPKEIIDRSSTVETRHEGGLGILLMNKFMSEIHYTRKDGENILVLIRNLG